ncbi:peptidyl-prolyl cis-trans isomerase FKBP10-like [Stigmatopora nigra]
MFCAGLLLFLHAAAVRCNGGVEGEAPPPLDVVVERYHMPKRCPREVKTEDFVRHHFNGTLQSNGKLFDSSHVRRKPHVSQVGMGRLIHGMDRGLLGGCVNERRRVIVPSHLAYGSVGTGNVIPPDAVLVYDVHLLDIWNTQDKIQIRTLSKPEHCARAAGASDFVRYHYNGTLLSGETFLSSHAKNATYDTYLGRGDLIEGMEQGLLGMCVAERRVVIVPPFLAYGENGHGKKVPSQATLVFDVLMVDVFNPRDDVVSEVQEVPEGCERRSVVGDFMRYHYNGTFQDGTAFDSSYQRNSTYNTYVGRRSVIAGVDRSLLGLCMGEKRKVVVPPHLAYGEEGVGDLIPGWAVLVFHIHVLDFHHPDDPVQVKAVYRPEGCGPLSREDDWLRYRYNCSLMDGTLLYSSDQYDEPSVTTLGANEVIPGLEQGLMGMCVGEVREVVVPPHWAHGENGAGTVPSSAVLFFQLELLELQKGVPKGFMFVWIEDPPEPLFPAMDLDGDGQVPLNEFSDFITQQVQLGNGRLRPGIPPDDIIRDMFQSQDLDKDGKIVAPEVTPQSEHRDEL